MHEANKSNNDVPEKLPPKKIKELKKKKKKKDFKKFVILQQLIFKQVYKFPNMAPVSTTMQHSCPFIYN